MASDIETRVFAAARRVFGTCPRCRGRVNFGLDEYRRATGECVNCGHDPIQPTMTPKEFDAKYDGVGARND